MSLDIISGFRPTPVEMVTRTCLECGEEYEAPSFVTSMDQSQFYCPLDRPVYNQSTRDPQAQITEDEEFVPCFI